MSSFYPQAGMPYYPNRTPYPLSSMNPPFNPNMMRPAIYSATMTAPMPSLTSQPLGQPVSQEKGTNWLMWLGGAAALVAGGCGVTYLMKPKQNNEEIAETAEEAAIQGEQAIEKSEQAAVKEVSVEPPKTNASKIAVTEIPERPTATTKLADSVANTTEKIENSISEAAEKGAEKSTGLLKKVGNIATHKAVLGAGTVAIGGYLMHRYAPIAAPVVKEFAGKLPGIARDSAAIIQANAGHYAGVFTDSVESVLSSAKSYMGMASDLMKEAASSVSSKMIPPYYHRP